MRKLIESPYVKEENHRFYIITQWAYVIGFFGHAAGIIQFKELGISEMVYFNIFYSVPCFAAAFFLNRSGRHNAAFTLAFLELLFHQVLSTYFMSWEAGAHFWLIYLAALCFFNPSWKTPLQYGLLAIILLSYVYMYFSFQEGIYLINERGLSTLNITNALITLTIISLLVNYYSRATRKAENKLKDEKAMTSSMLDKVGALFGQQVSEEIAQELISSEFEFESKQLEVSVMFLDIRDFTRFADTNEPNEVAGFQNAVFSELIQIVKENKGVVLQILGDGIMAVFGAPVINEDHAENAVNAGKKMVDRIQELGREGVIPPIRVGIGINSGKVIAGNLGNESRRFYSLTGKNVIIAARIEQLNKIYGSQMLISGMTYDELKLKPEVEEIGMIELRGIVDKVRIFNVL
ncbi:MAG: adenylate/guanylate cyclase domain-containing protein [Saprospiraceae bacterium]|nr:adenylate/guanylate cyclase domain-containing protein [Saprospiraceae bacterium]